MSLIYPEEAWARFGPAPIVVHDACGRRLRFVVACDPLTGEVIQNVHNSEWIVPLIRRVAITRDAIMQRLLGSYRSLLHPGSSIISRHYFAPAPLTISRVRP
jgi:hypothetical protein